VSPPGERCRVASLRDPGALVADIAREQGEAVRVIMAQDRSMSSPASPLPSVDPFTPLDASGFASREHPTTCA